MKKSPRVLMATLGRSHFISAADALVRNGVDLTLMQGWVPKNLNSLFVKFATIFIKRKSFIAGLGKRITPALKSHICSNPIPEFVQTILLLTIGRIGKLRGSIVTFSFLLYGFLSRKYLTKYDIFHVKSGLGQGGAIATAKRNGLKVIVDQGIAHSSFLEESFEKEYDRRGLTIKNESFWELVTKDCLEADVVQVNSEFIKDTFVKNGFPLGKIRVVYLGVRSDFNSLCEYRYLHGRTTLNLLFTGAFNMRKGAEYIICAMQMLKEEGVDFHLDVVGTCAGVGEDMRSYAIKSQLPVSFHGHVAQNQLCDFFKDSDIYIFPSLVEGCAQSGMEAMSAGLCVVASYESGLPIEDGKDGFIVPRCDTESIVEKIKMLIAHPRLIEKTGKSASNKLKHYTWDAYAKNVKSLYDELMATEKPR